MWGDTSPEPWFAGRGKGLSVTDSPEIADTVGACSIFFRQHEGQNPHGDSRVRRIVGSKLQGLIVIVDLPKELLPGQIERAEIMLGVRIVFGRKAVKGLNCPNGLRPCRIGKGGDACGRHHATANKGSSKAVVEFTDGYASIMPGLDRHVLLRAIDPSECGPIGEEESSAMLQFTAKADCSELDADNFKNCRIDRLGFYVAKQILH